MANPTKTKVKELLKAPPKPVPAKAPSSRRPDVINAMAKIGFGMPIPESLSVDLQARFGTPLDQVKLHDDRAAHAAASALKANAFTVGRDIFFAQDKFNPSSQQGRQLLAHELAHVAQLQRGLDPHPQAPQRISDPASPHELEAEKLSVQPGQPALTAPPQVIHRDEQDTKAEDFLLNYPAEISTELQAGIKANSFATNSPFLSWTADGETRFKSQIGYALFPPYSLQANLVAHLVPTSEYSILQTIRSTIDSDQSANAAPWVAYALMPLVTKKIDESLRRIAPRYTKARNQTVLSNGEKSQPTLEPAADQVPVSAPIDLAVVAALLAGTTTFDELAYRKAHPTEAKLLGNLGTKSPGSIIFLAAQGLPQWIRVTGKDITAEDVATELYGNSALAYDVVAAAPTFGIRPGRLIETYRKPWLEAVEAAGLKALAASARLGFYPVSSPINSIPGSALQDEVILNQAQALAPTGATQMEVVQQMRLALGLADQMIAGAKKFGLSGAISGMRARLDARSKKFAAADATADAASWGPQVAAQYGTLNAAAAGLDSASTELTSYGGGELPQFIRDPLYKLASAYVEAGALSEFADAGQQRLATAHDLNQTYTSDVLAGALDYIHDSLKAITSDQADAMGGDTSGLKSQETALRGELARIQNEIREDPKRAVELVKELQKKVNKLSSRVGVLSTLATIDSLLEALSTHVTNIYSTPSAYGMVSGLPAPLFGPSPDDWKDDAVKPYNQAIESLKGFRATWADIAKTAFTGTDEDLATQIKGAAAQQKELGPVIEKAVQLAKDAEDYDHIFAIYKTLLIGLAIAIVTFGVGELVAGAAIGVGFAEGGAGVFLASTTAEALTMTTLNAAVQGKEGWKNFGSDFIWNFATAGLMKGVARLYKGAIGAAAAKTTLGAAGEFTVTLIAGAIPAMAKADYDKRKKTGQGLTEAEAHAVVRDSIVQGIVLAIGMRVAGEFLPNFRQAGTKFGARIKAVNTARAEIRTQTEAVKTNLADEKAFEALKAKGNALLETESKIIEEAETTPNLPDDAKAELNEAKAATVKAAEEAGVQNVLPYIEDAGENQLLVSQGHMDDVKAFYQKPHAPPAPEPQTTPAAPAEPEHPPKVTELPPDEVTHARRIQVEPTDGSTPFTVTEKVTPGNEPAVASAKPADSVAPPPEVANTAKFKTLDDILTPDRKGFTDSDVQAKYQEYYDAKIKKGETPMGTDEWALSGTRGSGQAALEKVLGPDFRAQGDGKHMLDLGNIGRPTGLNDQKLATFWARISSRTGQFQARLKNFIVEGILNGKVNVGYFYNCKGMIAEILSEGYQQSVLADRQKAQPNARQFNEPYVIRGGTGDPVLFTDGMVGHPDGNGLAISDRFEVKSGASGGEQAARQYHKWVESHMVDGTKLLLNKRAAVPGETLAPGQERIGNMVFDVYYWKPTRAQLKANPGLRTVTGLSGGATLHAIMPEGGTVLSTESGDYTVPVKVENLPATASEINFLARMMMESIAPPAKPSSSP